jgi:predicted ATPase/DNA-binding winged helix-turn-helix (wHTH) protein
MAGPPTPARDVLSFGPFNLIASERLLSRGGAPVRLGARALDLLIALVSRPNEAIGKRDLIAFAWPDVTVDEGSLRFHIASLRKALGDGVGGARYVATLAGRGYCFVAPVLRATAGAPRPGRAAASLPGAGLLPPRLERMVGRDDDVRVVMNALADTRFVTLVGPGGVGKTTVAIAVGQELSETFQGAVIFLDLGALTDPAMAASSLMALLGIPVRSDDPIPSLLAYLRDKRFLLVIDNCEHVIDAAVSLASQIFGAAPLAHILATSRETLRIEGERVHRLVPLAVPPDDSALLLAAALSFPAVQLFVERAAASGAGLELRDEDAVVLAQICRRLDGVPLALELAAGRVQAYGLQQTLAILDQRLTMFWLGQRSAPPRQRTLQATLDWSFGLLTEPERRVLRRLAVFAGTFSLEAALAVAACGSIGQTEVLAAIDNLVAKSMLATHPAGPSMRYRLLDTTRGYILGNPSPDAERASLSARHAAYYRGWLERTGGEWPTFPTAQERAPHLADLANVRAALEWCFGADGQAEAGIALVVAAAPVLLAMSLLTECHRWTEQALLALGEGGDAGAEEMRLQAALGLSLMFTRGNGEAARLAFSRSLALAEARDDAPQQLRMLALLHTFHHRIGEFRRAMHYAQRGAAIPLALADAASVAVARSPLGSSLHHAGDLVGARAELEAVLRGAPGPKRSVTLYLGFDHHIYASVALARTLWLQGHPAQAMRRARQAVEDAAGMDHPVTLAVALAWALSVFLWAGDLEAVEEQAEWFIAHAESHSLAPYLAVGRGFQGELAIRRGNAAEGVRLLQDCLRELGAARYGQLTASFHAALAQGLSAQGRCAEAVALIDGTIDAIRSDGPLSLLSELLRVKGQVLLSMPQPDAAAAEALFLQSLDESRRQQARSWELRTATDLAALLAARGRRDEARALLQPVLGAFAEGLDTADLQAAGRLLADLG